MKRILGSMAVLIVVHFSAMPVAARANDKPIRILFLGNSFTAWNNLVDVITAMASEGNPPRAIDAHSVLFGGSTMEGHWDIYKTYRWIRFASLDVKGQEAFWKEMDAAQSQEGAARTARHAALTQRKLLNDIKRQGDKRKKWDYVVLQSYCTRVRPDVKDGMESSYAKYVRKFAEVAKEEGARVILYGTAVEALNGVPLEKAPDASEVKDEALFFAELARELDAWVVPVFMGVNAAQRANQNLIFRWQKNSHPSQECTYLTALMFFSVLFDQEPTAVKVNEVTFRTPRDGKDPDGRPATMAFNAEQQAFFKKTAWETVQEFQKMGGKK